MATQSILKFARISPQKARLVADQVRGLPVYKALDILTFSNKKGADLIKKVVESAIANADRHDPEAEVDNFRVITAYVDEARALKRFRPRAMGRASGIKKRSSHITLEIGE